MKTPKDIAALVKPTHKAPAARRVWSVDLDNTWIPFFMATNVTGATELPSEDLGAPLRLAKAKDGSVRFGTNGRPTLRVAPGLNDAITDVRVNFIAGLQTFTDSVIKDDKDGYQAQVRNAQKAGQPIIAAMQHDVDEAVMAYTAARLAQASAAVEEAEHIVAPTLEPAAA